MRLVGRIVETEAYLERDDAASHSFLGPTLRNRSMYAPPGTLYVYRIHQVHCANVVARPGSAVLIRGVEPLNGAAWNGTGPGRFCRAYRITKELDGTDVLRGPVMIRSGQGPRPGILQGPRVGIRRSMDLPLRMSIAGNQFVSLPRPSAGR